MSRTTAAGLFKVYFDFQNFHLTTRLRAASFVSIVLYPILVNFSYNILLICLCCFIMGFFSTFSRPSWPWSYSWIYNYLCNKCIITNVYGQVYSIQHYVIKFVSDLRQVGGFLRVLRFPPIKLTPWYSWTIVESGVKHHNPNLLLLYPVLTVERSIIKIFL